MKLVELQKKLKEQKVTQMIVSSKARIHYLIDRSFDCGERMIALLVKQDKAYLFLNELFPCSPIEGVEIINFNDCDRPVELLNDYLDEGKCGVDSEYRAVFLLQLLKMHSEIEYLSDLIDEMQAIKNAEEIVKMRQASLYNDEVMNRVRGLIHVGISEIELANQIHDLFVEVSGGGESFETIVAFGEHGADPHCVPGERRLKEKECIIIDMGCKCEGYCSDMTRTFFVNENNMKEIYDCVKQANLAAKAVIKPGVKFSDIDRAAREVIENAGHGKAFFHRLGHGIGLSVHEPYDVSGSNDRFVQEGMCFSIEPGIYYPEIGGVRLEDLVVVTKDGCEVLNHASLDDEVI